MTRTLQLLGASLLLAVLLLLTGQGHARPRYRCQALKGDQTAYLSCRVDYYASWTRTLMAANRARVPRGSNLERDFLCIHSFEASWTDAGAPYYGGLQMDMSFQRAYGAPFLSAWGPATFWPVSVQMAVAMRAYLSRGFSPWPNTSRMCGL